MKKLLFRSVYKFIFILLITSSISSSYANNTDDFITTWKTDNPGISNSTSITIPTVGNGYNYNIDWGDGNSNTNVTGQITHDYGTPGTYTVAINGSFPRIYFNNTGDKEKIISIEQWGTGIWSSMEKAFYGTHNLMINATDAPDLSNTKKIDYMFADARSMNQDLNHWNTQNIQYMNGVFMDAISFNGNINNWDVSNVKKMSQMFQNASNFNQDLNNWNTSNVESLSRMFDGAVTFDGNITNWNVGSVKYISKIFQHATSFNQDISNWNISGIINMSQMFKGATNFDQNLGSWDLSATTNLDDIFEDVILSDENYDAILNGWSTQSLQSNIDFQGGNSQYCFSGEGRNILIDTYGWNIEDDGQKSVCSKSEKSELISILPDYEIFNKVIVNASDVSNDSLLSVNILDHNDSILGTHNMLNGKNTINLTPITTNISEIYVEFIWELKNGEIVVAKIENFSVNHQDIDTDNDGISDYTEVHTHGTDPNKSDSDDDGLGDLEEVNMYQTNPNNSDSDNDGSDDLMETRFLGTDATQFDRIYSSNGSGASHGTKTYAGSKKSEKNNQAFYNDKKIAEIHSSKENYINYLQDLNTERHQGVTLTRINRNGEIVYAGYRSGRIHHDEYNITNQIIQRRSKQKNNHNNTKSTRKESLLASSIRQVRKTLGQKNRKTKILSDTITAKETKAIKTVSEIDDNRTAFSVETNPTIKMKQNQNNNNKRIGIIQKIRQYSTADTINNAKPKLKKIINERQKFARKRPKKTANSNISRMNNGIDQSIIKQLRSNRHPAASLFLR